MTMWTRAGSSYVCECRPGYEAVVELSEARAYSTPWGRVERPAEAVLTVVETASGRPVAKRLRVPGATLPADASGAASKVVDARITELERREEDLAERGWHYDSCAGVLEVDARGSRGVAEYPLAYGSVGNVADGMPCITVSRADGGYSADWHPDGPDAPAAAEGQARPSLLDAIGGIAELIVGQGLAGGRDHEDDDLARYEKLYAGDMETYEHTNLDELIRACRASARFGASTKMREGSVLR